MKLKVDESIVLAIHSRQIKLDNLKMLLLFSMSGYEDINDDDIEDLKADYLNIYSEYEFLKNKLQNLIITATGIDKQINWSLDFSTQEVSYDTE